MILDSSAVIAILRKEPVARAFSEVIEAASAIRMSAANLFEAAIVIDSKRNAIASREFDAFARASHLVIVPFDELQARIAREAYRDFGKGSGHPARLNFGDCFAYALAKATGEPLLFTGNDFSHTDVARAR